MARTSSTMAMPSLKSTSSSVSTSQQSSSATLDDNLDQDEWAWMSESSVSTAQMNSLVMDYLLTEGYAEAAERFAEESGCARPPAYANSTASYSIFMQIMLQWTKT